VIGFSDSPENDNKRTTRGPEKARSFPSNLDLDRTGARLPMEENSEPRAEATLSRLRRPVINITARCDERAKPGLGASNVSSASTTASEWPTSDEVQLPLFGVELASLICETVDSLRTRKLL
jgi:hypothetical protein